jgi:hypothetical protein
MFYVFSKIEMEGIKEEEPQIYTVDPVYSERVGAVKSVH